MATTQFFLDLVTVLDKWVIVVSVLSMGYLLLNFTRFYRKYVVGSYILVLSLFAFWSIRAVYTAHPVINSTPFLAVSFIMDLFVVTFAASIIYHYQKWGDLAYVRKLFGLQKVNEVEIVEYQGPHLQKINPGKYYLILEQGRSYEWHLFDDLSTELPAIAFTRKHPSKINIDTESRDITFYWLSESDVAEDEDNVMVIEPFRRGRMEEIMVSFVKNHRNPVILIDGLEYLIYKNSPAAMIEFVQELHDSLAHRHDTTILYSLDREGISDQVFSVLKEEMDEIRSIDQDGKVEKQVF